MATHIRRAILEHHKAQLKLLSGSGNVWISRGFPPREGRPAFTLFDESESAEVATIHAGQRPQLRTMTLVITGWTVYEVLDPEKSEERMDALALSIEQAVTKPATVDDLQLISTEKQLDEEDPKQSAVTLRFSVIYRTTERNPVA